MDDELKDLQNTFKKALGLSSVSHIKESLDTNREKQAFAKSRAIDRLKESIHPKPVTRVITRIIIEAIVTTEKIPANFDELIYLHKNDPSAIQVVNMKVNKDAW